MSECRDRLSREGKPSPRYCGVCGLGPCHERLPILFNGPGYWMLEKSGVLRPAVVAYLAGPGEPMTEPQIAAMRAYLRQWIEAPVWHGVDHLRAGVDGLTDRGAIAEWLLLAHDLGIDPL